MKRRGWVVLVPQWPDFRLKPMDVRFERRELADFIARQEWGDDCALVRATVEYEMPCRTDQQSEGVK